MNIPQLFLLLAIIIDVVRNEAVAYESSSLQELNVTRNDEVTSFHDFIDVVADFNTKTEDWNEFHYQIKKLITDLDRPIPAFTAMMGTGLQTFPVNETIPFTQIRLNVDNCFDKTTSAFKAIVSGTYYFSLTTLNFENNDSLAVDIVAGDGNEVLGHIYQLPNEKTHAMTIYVLAHLDAGEEVWIRCASIICQMHAGYYSVFSGFLVLG